MSLPAYPELPGGVLLCIDDNQTLLDWEKSFLEDYGYTVLTAPSGSKGLELASTCTVDVVIVDYLMPDMNGQEIAAAMRQIRPQAPIIMLSATLDVPEQALKLVDACIARKFVGTQLLPAIARLHAGGWTPPSSYDA
jgi:DNA-binding response OmpR family regulator